MKNFLLNFIGNNLFILLFIISCSWQVHHFVLGDVTHSFGVNIHFTSPRVGEMKMLAEGGWKWIRTDFTWQSIEKQKGKYTWDNWDTLVKNLDQYKIRAMFVLDYSNTLYDGGLSPYTDEARQAFANFTVAGVERYQGKGFIWELWNEPDQPYSWKPIPSAYYYSQLAITVGKALKSKFPNETFVGPAVSTFYNLPYLTDVFLYGVLEYFDAVSIHGYGNRKKKTILNQTKQKN